MKKRRKWLKPVLVLLVALAAGAAYVGYRAYRTVSVGRSIHAQVRYLIENGGTIGEVPADQAFSVDFLEAIFGDNPELLSHLQALVRKGLSDDPALHVGEVAAMLVTYQTDENGKVSDVVIHAVGGFPLARRRPGFHSGGYFFQQLDKNLWSYGNIVIGFLGRDVVLFADNEETAARQEELIDTLFTGEIMPLVNKLARPLYFTMVFPEPRHVIPPQLRHHMQAIVLKGFISKYKGHAEVLALSPSARSADYAASILKDLKLVAELTLRTRWHGDERQTPWGPVRNPWWAYEMVQTLQASEMTKEETLIRFSTDFERVMVNAILKSIERLSRDLAAMKSTFDERLDPRLTDAKLRTKKPMHYWSEEHQWGPDWPIPPIMTNRTEGGASAAEPETQASDQQASTGEPASAL